MSTRQLMVLLGLVAAVTVTVQGRATGAADAAPANTVAGNGLRARSEVAGYLANIRFVYRLYEECSSQQFSPCLKKKVIVALDRAGKSTKYLSLMDGVRFVQDPNFEPAEPVTEKDVESILKEARSLDDPDSILNQMILDKIIYFFTTHTLEFKLFDKSASGRSMGEGRRRRLNSLLMVPLLLGGTLIPLAFGALALLAGKALIVSKLALALAAIIGLRRLVGSGGGESYQVVTVPHHGTGHYKRSMEDVHQLAYLGYMPATLGAVPAPATGDAVHAASRLDQLQGIRR